jgi:cell division protein FtsB
MKNALFCHGRVTTSARPSGSASSTLARRGPRIAQYVLLALIAVVAVDALVGEKGLLDRMKAGAEIRGLESTLGRARAENGRLGEQARQLREDPVALEELARRDFGFIKPGERLFIVKDVRPDQTSQGLRR